MSMALTIVIALVASIIGGILAGLFVTRKISYDNKRMYANQTFYGDVKSMYIMTRKFTFQYLQFLGCNSNELGLLTTEAPDAKSILSSLSALCRWQKTNESQWTSRVDVGKLVQSTKSIVKAIDASSDVGNVFAKYPLQVSYFDKLYPALRDLEILRVALDVMDPNDVDSINGSINLIIYTMLCLVEHLSKVDSDLEYYRKAKSWTWRLFIPSFRNQ